MTIMELFLIVLAIFGALLYFNRYYLKSLWKEHFCGDYNDSHPPFCFECNYSTCDTCKAKELWNNGEKDQAWKQFKDDELDK